jgi:hypothetical protein
MEIVAAQGRLKNGGRVWLRAALTQVRRDHEREFGNRNPSAANGLTARGRLDPRLITQPGRRSTLS